MTEVEVRQNLNLFLVKHFLVLLNATDDEAGSDYINANYIAGNNGKREFIATQGPLPGKTRIKIFFMTLAFFVFVLVCMKDHTFLCRLKTKALYSLLDSN